MPNLENGSYKCLNTVTSVQNEVNKPKFHILPITLMQIHRPAFGRKPGWNRLSHGN